MTSGTRVGLLLLASGWAANQFIALIPVYRLRLNLTDAQAATAFGIYALGLLPGLLGGGPLSDRWGRRVVAIPGGLTLMVGNGVLLAARNEYMGLLAGRLLVGLGAGIVFGSASAWMLDLEGGRAPRRISLFLSLGFGLGPLIAGTLATISASAVVVPYLAHLPVLGLALVIGATAHSSQLRPGVRAALLPGAAPFRAAPVAMRVLVIAPWIFAFPSVSFVTFPSQVSPSGMPRPLFVGLMAACTLLPGAWAARIGNSSRAPWGVALGGMGLLLGQVAVETVWLPGLLIAGAFLGVAHGVVLSSTLRFLSEVVPPALYGRSLGLMYGVAYLGFGVPLLLAKASVAGPVIRPVLGLAVCALVSGLFAARLKLSGEAEPGPRVSSAGPQ